MLPVPQWGLRLRVVCSRKRVFHPTAKNHQLDLFSPDDGTFEYSAVATNLGLCPSKLWLFMAGRGAQEKTLAELKSSLAFDTVPTRHDVRRRRSPISTCLFPLESILTSCFEWLNVGGRLLRLAEGLTLRLPNGPALEKRYRSWLRAA